MADAGAKRREERVKLFASAISNVGVATIVTGLIAPVLSGRAHAVQDVAAFVAGLALHLIAQGVLHYVVDAPRPDEAAELGDHEGSA
jgi:ABC-type xylose transport system permease subunit